MTSVRGSRSLVEQVSEMHPGDAVAAAADVMSSDTPRRTHRTAANEVIVVLCNRPQQLSPVSLQGVGFKPTRITVIATIRRGVYSPGFDSNGAPTPTNLLVSGVIRRLDPP